MNDVLYSQELSIVLLYLYAYIGMSLYVDILGEATMVHKRFIS